LRRATAERSPAVPRPASLGVSTGHGRGGRQALPGEISLAHRGVLFLDELPHFKPSVLEVLREPLEVGYISIARAGYRARFPAAFQLIAAMNPCPAGQRCSEHTCRCMPDQVRRYQSRISGPLLDRIDLHAALAPVPTEQMLSTAGMTDNATASRQRIAAARDIQQRRQGCLNSALPGSQTLAAACLDGAGRRLLQRSAERFGLSARGTHRVLRAARTVADLEGAATVSAKALGEALSYRALDWSATLGMGPR
jgi:magnesium chelatase family protein